MAEYKVILTVKDRYGNTKEVDGGTLNLDLDVGEELGDLITQATKDYIEETGIPIPPQSRIDYVTLLSDAWKSDGNQHYQVVDIADITANSQVDLTPSKEQLAAFYEKDIAFVTENVGGVVTVCAIGQKPQNDYTIQVTITEVEYE